MLGAGHQKTSTYTLLMDRRDWMTDELDGQKAWMNRELTRAAGESGLCVSGNV